MCEKKPGANLPGVVRHKLWRGQLREPVPHTPVHSGRSPRVMVVAQEVDGLAVLPGDGTQSSPALEFVPAVRSASCRVSWRKEREHSVEHLVGRVHILVHLIDQVQEAPEGEEAVAFYDFPETGGVRDEVVAGPLPVTLIPGLDNALLHLKPKAEECFQHSDSDGLKILGIE